MLPTQHHAVLSLPKIPTQNNMDALRLLFACLVVGAHAFDLSLNVTLASLRPFFDSGLAVRGFFILSGFLVFMSFEQSGSLLRYAAKRARRIYPAYLAVILIAATVGGVITNLPLAQYVGKELAAYLLANLVFLNFLHPDLPGVFGNNPVTAVDGALWTIKIEVAFYLCVPVIVWLMRRLGRARVLAACYVASIFYLEFCRWRFHETQNPLWQTLAEQLPGQLAFFIAGATVYYYFDLFKKYLRPLVICGTVLWLAGWRADIAAVYPAGLALIVMAAAFGPRLGNAGRFGDFSYGVYIWHFPIIQCLIAAGVFAAAPLGGLIAAYALALTAAALSWHLVEKRWLFRSSHYVAAEKAK